MIALLAVYLTGVATLLLADVFDEVHLAPLVRAFWAARYFWRPSGPLPAMWHVAAPVGETADLAVAARIFHRPRLEEYVGRHRAVEVVGWNWPTQEMLLPDFDGDVGPYQPKAGVGRYSHLSPDELAWRAEHQERALALHVDLAALRIATVYEWELAT